LILCVYWVVIHETLLHFENIPSDFANTWYIYPDCSFASGRILRQPLCISDTCWNRLIISRSLRRSFYFIIFLSLGTL